MADIQLEQPTFTVYTWFDITSTGVTKASSRNAYERNQQRNWETLQQVLGLRTQPLNLQTPKQITGADLSQFNFGSDYTGKANVWTTEFTVDQVDVFTRDGDTVALLKEDADLIPMITELAESVLINPACTQTSGQHCNIYFQLSYLSTESE